MSPFVLTTDHTIHEVVEIAGATKVMRRTLGDGQSAWVDLRNAQGLRSALKMIGTAAEVENAVQWYRSWSPHGGSPEPRCEDLPLSSEQLAVARRRLKSSLSEGVSHQDMHDEVCSWGLARHSAGLSSPVGLSTPYGPDQKSDVERQYVEYEASYVDMYGFARPHGTPYWSNGMPCCCGLQMNTAADGPSKCRVCGERMAENSPALERSDVERLAASILKGLRNRGDHPDEPGANEAGGVVERLQCVLDRPGTTLMSSDFVPPEVEVIEMLGYEVQDGAD